VKVELQKRCVNIDYRVSGKRLKRVPIEQEINQSRHQFGSALLLVLQRFLSIRLEQRNAPNPLPDFEEHFTELCNLLWAYGEVAGKETGGKVQIPVSAFPLPVSKGIIVKELDAVGLSVEMFSLILKKCDYKLPTSSNLGDLLICLLTRWSVRIEEGLQTFSMNLQASDRDLKSLPLREIS
jgi:hypothetical protein